MKTKTQPFRLSLVFVHNHRHEANIARLDKLFGERFETIQHLVPFYRGSAPNVIPVYESSFRFQNYFAQGLRQFFKADCTHYLFCGDDVMFNPRLTGENFCTELGLDPGSGYIKYLEPITEARFDWPHVANTLGTLARVSGSNWKAELPEPNLLREQFRKHGVEVGKLSWRQFKNGIRPQQGLRLLTYALMRRLGGARWKEIAVPPYPLLAGYADFVVVPADAINDFCHYCGVFAAANIFVEFGLPTALAMSCQRIVYEKNGPWKGVELWGQDVTNFGEAHKYSLTALFERFPANQLYVHPIKLSKWS